MSGVIYYLQTFAASLTSVFGIRFAYEQPRYAVVQDLGQGVQVRRSEARQAIEASVRNGDRDKAARQAFRLLFDYIAGANQRRQRIAMTTPVRTDAERIAMTTPVQTSIEADTISMRFFLPRSVVEAGAPAPVDPRLHLVQVPPATIAALRYSGRPAQAARVRQTAALTAELAKSGWTPSGDVFQLDYDPPFTIPFLRRNEIAMAVTQ